MLTHRAVLLFVLLILFSPTAASIGGQNADKNIIETVAYIPQHWFQTSDNADKITTDNGTGRENIVLNEMIRQGLFYQNSDFNILLKAHQFVLGRGLSTALKAKINKITAIDPTKRTHGLVQFEHILTLKEREELKREGVELLAYVPNNAWYVSLPAGKASQIAAKPIVRAIDVIKPEYKISPYLQEGKIGDWAIDGNDAIIVMVSFHSDISLKDAEHLINEKYKSRIYGRTDLINALAIAMPVASIWQLAGEDSVEWIEQVSPPIVPALEDARPAIGADTILAPPYYLSGAGVTAFIAEAGDLVDNTHNCLKMPRVTRDTNSGTTGNHATLVGGIVGASAACSFQDINGNHDFRGVAPSVGIYSDSIGNLGYFDTTTIQTEYPKAVTEHWVDVANNSWATDITISCPGALCPLSCGWAGDYTFAAQLFDGIVRGDLGTDLPVVFAVGNDRSKGFCGTDPANPNNNYGTIAPPSTAKNVISVGAVNSLDDSMTGFSNWGPTGDPIFDPDDMRIKPDVVAPGCGGDFSYRPSEVVVINPIPGDGFAHLGECGTSLAAPMVTGSIALMIQQYRQLHSSDPSPSLLKALLIHTAKDLGNAGPDYQNGYGRIDVNKAVNAIINESFKEGSFPDILGSDSYYITVPAGAPELKVTLVWDDYPGVPFVKPGLMNNLDLVLIDSNGSQHNPWILNPYSPSTPATTGYDFSNNVEQVYVANPISGTWEIRVSGSPVVMPPQPYSFVSEFLGITPGGCAPMEEMQLTTDPQVQKRAVVSSSNAVWEDTRNTVRNIYRYDLATKIEYRVTNNTVDEYWPSTDGDIIAWRTSLGAKVYMCKLSLNGSAGGCLLNDAKMVVHDVNINGSPDAYGTKVVWTDGALAGKYSVYLCDTTLNSTDGGCLAGDKKTALTDFSALRDSARIHGNTIVWFQKPSLASSSYYDIYRYDLTEMTAYPVSTAPQVQEYPDVYGDIIVWDSNEAGNFDIYMCELSRNGLPGGCLETDAKTQVTSSPQNETRPSIYEDKIAWEDSRNGNKDIYMYYLPTSTETQITTNDANQTQPSIYGNKIVWTDDRNGNPDIYMATLSPSCTGNQLPTAAITAPADGAIVALGNTVTFTGNGNDAEDGALTGSSLIWGSNIDGIIGNGETFSTSALSTGKHTITLTASDFAGTIGQDSVEVTVGCVEEEIQITTDTNDQRFPAIYGNKIAWQDAKNGNLDIYIYDLNTSTETRITTNTADQFYSAIYGNTIVWDDYRNGSSNRDIYMYDLLTSDENQITTNIYDQYDPAIYDTNIVWMDKRSGGTYPWDIYMYDISTSTENSVTTNTYDQMFPAIYGSKIVWQDYRPGGGVPGIYLYDLNTGIERKVTPSITKQFTPAIYEDKVVWYDNRNGNYDIYMYDLSTSTETRITTNSGNQYDPEIYGDKVVWYDDRAGNYDIYMYDLSTSTETQISTNTADQWQPAIYGNKVVWFDNRNGNWDIYIAILSPMCITTNQPPTISGIPDQNLMEDSGLNADLIDLWAFASDPESSDSLLTFTIVSETNPAVVDCVIESDKNIGCMTKINQFGYSDVTVQVSDGNSTATDTLRVNVLAVNDPPNIAGLPNQALNVNSGTNPSLIDLWVYAFDIETPDENLAFSIVSETATGVVDCTVSSNRYIDCAVQPGQNGYSDVNVQVSDGELTDTDAFRVSVSVVNGPPEVVSFSPPSDPTITEEEQQVFSISASDPDGDVLDVNWYVSAQYAGSGLGYTYVADYNAAGKRYVTAVVYDGNYSTPKEWLLTVTNVNRPPQVSGIPDVNFEEDGNYTGLDLDNYGSDPDGDDITWSYSGNTNVFVSIDANNVVTFTAAPDWFGSEIITFSATDYEGASGYDDVNITVTQANNPPVATILSPANDTNFGCQNPITFSGSAADAEDGQLTGDSLEWSSDINGVLGNGETISAALPSGVHTITLDATDSQGGIGSDSATIQVICTNVVVTQITTDPASQTWAAIYGNKIVWADFRNNNYDVYMYDISTSTETRVTPNTADQSWPAIYGDKIVYHDNRKRVSGPQMYNYDIYMYDLSTHTETRITTDPAKQEYPAIYGDKIVWRDYRNGNYDIYMYDLNTGTETRVTTDAGWQNFPAISGGRIVWPDNRNGNWDVYMYDISTGTETRVTTDPTVQERPAIYGNRIVWLDYRNGRSDIYMYDISTGTETMVPATAGWKGFPDIYTDKIAYTDSRNGKPDIYMYDLFTGIETQITNDLTEQTWPAIYGSKIVWHTQQYYPDIYMAVVS